MGEATIPCLSGTKLFFYRHLTIRLQKYNEKKTFLPTKTTDNLSKLTVVTVCFFCSAGWETISVFFMDIS